MNRVGLYAGSFDVLTNGHLWMIQESARLFDHLIIAVADHPDKRYLFTAEERCAMLAQVVSVLTTFEKHSIETAYLTNRFLVHYACEQGATHIVRGIRNEQDFRFEHTLRQVNEDIAGPDCEVQTVFLMPPRPLSEVSSSIVRGFVGVEGWEKIVAHMVPNVVFESLKAKHEERTKA